MDRWTEFENKYGIKFRLNDGNFRPVNEWLDDLYLKLNDRQQIELLVDIDTYADELFGELFSHKK